RRGTGRRLLLVLARARRAAHQQPGGVARTPAGRRRLPAPYARARGGQPEGDPPRHPGSAPVGRPRAVCVRAFRRLGRRGCPPRLLHEPARRCPHLVARRAWTTRAPLAVACADSADLETGGTLWYFRHIYDRGGGV